MAWIVRLVSIGAEGEEHSTDVMRIAKPDTLSDLGTLGLSLAESKQLLAGIQRGDRRRASPGPCRAPSGVPRLRRGLPDQGLPPPCDRHAVRPGDRPTASLP